VIDGLYVYITVSSHQPSVYPYLVTDIALPELCHHQIAVSVTVTSKIWDIEYTSMQSPVYQVTITMTVSLPSRSGTSVSMYVSMLERDALGSYIFRYRMFY
jgi:hypothetical protein